MKTFHQLYLDILEQEAGKAEAMVIMCTNTVSTQLFSLP